jgi:AAA domain
MADHNRPHATRTNYLAHIDQIPDELKAIDQWCVFSLVPQGNGKTKKLPLVAGGKDQRAAVDDPRTLRPYAVALRDAQVRGTALGFAFTPDLGFFFLDADDVLAEGGDDARPDIRELWETFDTYTEVSVSGKGVHIIGRGSFLPDAAPLVGSNGHKPIEYYPRRGGRFCLLTGEVLAGYERVRERGEVLARVFPKRVRGMHEPPPVATGALTEAEGNAIVEWAGEFWVDGQRNAMALHLSGVLAVSGVPRAQAVRIVERCAWSDSDPGAKIQACHNTYDKHEAGDPVMGWLGLRDVVGLTKEQVSSLDTLVATYKLRNTVKKNGSAPSPLAGIITADALDRIIFTDPLWAVPGVLPPGASMLVGKPKLGKSWLLLNMALAIAYGGRALGQIPVDQGEVLLLCLEDSARRLQQRLRMMTGGQPLPSALHLVTDWPRFDQGGADYLREWTVQHPDARLIGIDVLARMRQPSGEQGNHYAQDYALMQTVKRLADESEVPTVIVHHARKASADDPFDMISGTHGLGGAADTALILHKLPGVPTASLYLRGRDVEEAEFALKFDPVLGMWAMTSDDPAPTVSEPRQDLLDALTKKGPMTPKDAAEYLMQDRAKVRQTLHRMYQAGQVKARGGKYYVEGSEHAPPSETEGGQIIFPWG